MIAQLTVNDETHRVDLRKPLDISMPIKAHKSNPSAWYVAPPSIEPVRNDQFIGSVKEGGSVNFRDISFNPHGNGTHTECVGHISDEVYSINDTLKQFFFIAELITINPKKLDNGDHVILWEQIQSKRVNKTAEAIIIRTHPNSIDKLSRQYSNTNPPFIEAKAMQLLVEDGIKHFLIDLPSVDKELDNGKLEAHHAFWEHPENTNLERTITELIYVSDDIKDGNYLLNLQISSFENDASPSKPILFEFFK